MNRKSDNIIEQNNDLSVQNADLITKLDEVSGDVVVKSDKRQNYEKLAREFSVIFTANVTM